MICVQVAIFPQFGLIYSKFPPFWPPKSFFAPLVLIHSRFSLFLVSKLILFVTRLNLHLDISTYDFRTRRYSLS